MLLVACSVTLALASCVTTARRRDDAVDTRRGKSQRRADQVVATAAAAVDVGPGRLDGEVGRVQQQQAFTPASIAHAGAQVGAAAVVEVALGRHFHEAAVAACQAAAVGTTCTGVTAKPGGAVRPHDHRAAVAAVGGVRQQLRAAQAPSPCRHGARARFCPGNHRPHAAGRRPWRRWRPAPPCRRAGCADPAPAGRRLRPAPRPCWPCRSPPSGLARRRPGAACRRRPAWCCLRPA